MIGAVAVRYDREGEDGMTEIYIPVFEGQDIHGFWFQKNHRRYNIYIPVPRS